MGYSFKWILEHISQSFAAVSASHATYAQTAGTAATASFVTASNVYGPYGSNSILSASWALTAAYAMNGGTGGGGSGAPGGPLNSIQFNSASVMTGSANFTFVTASTSVFLTGSQFITGSSTITGSYLITGSIRQTGSMFVSGAISASFGPNTVGFFGTASWAVSASRATTASYVNLLAGPNITINYQASGIAITGSGATTTINGVDEYMSRFSGSNNMETSSFINRRALYSFHSIDSGSVSIPNTPSSQSFLFGQQNEHYNTFGAVSIGHATLQSEVSHSLTTNYGTSVSSNYDVAMNLVTSTSPKAQFRGVSKQSVVANGNSYPWCIFDQYSGANIDDIFDLNSLDSLRYKLIIYDHTAGKLVRSDSAFIYTDLSCTTLAAVTFTGRGIVTNAALQYYDGTGVPENSSNMYSVYFVDSLPNTYYTNFKANNASGFDSTAYGAASQASNYKTMAAGFANNASGVGTHAFGSGSTTDGVRTAAWSKAGLAEGAFSIAGKSYGTNASKWSDIGGVQYTLFFSESLENQDIRSFLQNYGYILGAKSPYPAILVYPGANYCEPIELLLDTNNGDLISTTLAPLINGGSPGSNEAPYKAYILLSALDNWYAANDTDSRTPDGNDWPYANTALGYYNKSDGTGSFAGGIDSTARGASAFAFGSGAYAVNNSTYVFGESFLSDITSSFNVGFSDKAWPIGTTTPNLFVKYLFAGVNTNQAPVPHDNATFIGLRVNQDIWANRDIYAQRNLYVTGSSYLGNDLADVTRVTGSLLVTNSFELRGTGRVTGSFIISSSFGATNALNVIGVSQTTGSMIVSNSFNLIGTGRVTGSLIVSNSLNVIGTSSVTGSNIITGSWQLIGSGSVTGSLIVSSSLTVIGRLTVSGSFIDTGSFQLIGNGAVSGSLIVSNSLSTIGTNVTTGSLITSGTLQLIGTGTVTGSLIVSNSLTTIGTNTTTGSLIATGSVQVIGNQQITGSILMTGSGFISKVEYIDFNITGSDTYPTHQEGRVHWIDDTKTINVDTDVNDFSIELGHQSVVRVRNTNAFTVTKGKIVYINGESGNRPTIATSSYFNDPTSADTVGWVAQDISTNQTGYVITSGIIRGVNTNAYTPGTPLYLSSDGDWTSTAPDAPLHEVRVGKVVTQGVQGSVYVNIMNGYELTELHDVKTTTYSDGDLLIQSNSLWINSKQLTGSYAITGSLEVLGGITGSVQGTATSVVNSLTQGAGIDAFSFNGSAAQTVAVSGASSLTTNTITKWNGSAFANTNVTDNGSLVNINSNTGITGSVYVKSTFGTQTQPAMQVNTEGVFVIGEYTTTPTAVIGGIIYSGSEFYFGF